MHTIRKKFEFEAAHVLSSSYSEECQQIHGHSYIVEVFISGPLNEDGMVIDFKKLNEIVRPLLERWDHKVLIEGEPVADGNFLHTGSVQEFLKGSLVLTDRNPTAEWMSEYLYYNIRPELTMARPSIDLRLKVRVHETRTGWAEYSED